MKVTGFINRTEESQFEFCFEMNDNTYYVPKIEINLKWITRLREAALNGKCTLIEFRDLDLSGDVTKLIEIQEVISSDKSCTPDNTCSFCSHIYIRSKEHLYTDDCIVWVDNDECDPPVFKLYISGAYMPIGYCPMCGRKLRSEWL